MLPEKFLENLEKVIPQELFEQVIQSFSIEKSVSFRINSLKVEDEEIVLDELKNSGINCSPFSWITGGYYTDYQNRDLLIGHECVKKGEVYIQNFSSMFVPIVLDVRPQENVLDLCAAPGSKTTQMAGMMNNEGSIVAIEHIKGRFFKLKTVVELLGAGNVQVKLMDGRRYHPKFTVFDKILVDAPCSSEGRFSCLNKKTFSYWHPKKVKETAHKQKGLLLNASRYLKKGGTLVYSTCTFSPEENEGVINWFLRKTQNTFVIEPINTFDLQTYPAIMQWGKKVFHEDTQRCVRILPTKKMDGFFITKLRKL